MAFDNHNRDATPEPQEDSEPQPVDPTCSQQPEPNHDQSPGLQTSSSSVTTHNKKLQVNLRPPQRTRSHQTDSRMTSCSSTQITYHTVATQTDHAFQDDIPSGPADFSDSEGDDEVQCEDDVDYDPTADDGRYNL